MGQVNEVGTGETFASDARKFGFDPAELAQSVRAWFAGRASSPEAGKYQTEKGGTKYHVAFKYASNTCRLTLTSVAKAA
jgi:hypothetical protein